jgi:hypothetical protein
VKNQKKGSSAGAGEIKKKHSRKETVKGREAMRSNKPFKAHFQVSRLNTQVFLSYNPTGIV